MRYFIVCIDLFFSPIDYFQSHYRQQRRSKCAHFWSVWEFSRNIPGSRIAEYCVQLCLYLQILHPPKAHENPVFPHILLYVTLSNFLTFADMIHLKWYFVVLICFSLITCKFEYFFPILIAIWVSSVSSLFTYFVHFLLSFLYFSCYFVEIFSKFQAFVPWWC